MSLDIGAEIIGIVLVSPSFAGVLRPKILKKCSGLRLSGSAELDRWMLLAANDNVGLPGVPLALLSIDASDSRFMFGFACL